MSYFSHAVLTVNRNDDLRPLIKVMLIMALIFLIILIMSRIFGFLTVDNVKTLIEAAADIDRTWLICVVIFLLFLDLFVTVPTLSVTILAGYFLGFPLGALTAFIGMSSAAFSGYGISRKWGQRPISFLVKDDKERQCLSQAFLRNGPIMILLARAAPMVPEITALMAGAVKMKFITYAMWFCLGTAPYAAIAAYAGSVSSLDSPQPAIIAALSLYAVLWGAWYVFRLRLKRQT